MSTWPARGLTGVHTLRRETRLLAKYARNGVAHRVVGPALSPWRPGAVVVFHIGRCGSTVLSDLLDQHPRVYWDGETYGRVIAGIKRSGRSRADVHFDPVRYVDRRLSRSGNRWFGFDLKFSHVTEFGQSIEDYVAGLRRAGVTHFVVLRRSNYVRHAISGINGGRRGRYHHRADVPQTLVPFALPLHDVPVDLYRSSLLDHFARWDRLYDEVSRLVGPAALTITYEEDIAPNPLIGYRRVQDFLGLPAYRPRVRIRKANPEPLGDLIANLDEVRSYLAGSPYAWMADASG